MNKYTTDVLKIKYKYTNKFYIKIIMLITFHIVVN